MAPSTSLYALFAIFLAACLQLVAGDDVNVGFEATINATGIEIYRADEFRSDQFSGEANVSIVDPGEPAAIRGSDVSEFTFFVPVAITRYSSASQVLALTLFARPYDYDEDQAPEELVVYRESIYIYNQDYYEVAATFNISTNATDTPVYYLRAQLDIVDADADSEEYSQTISGVAVLSYNLTSGSWTPHEPSVFAHAENEAIHAEYEAELALSSEPPIDTTSRTVIRDQDPDLPEDAPDATVVEPPAEDVTPSPIKNKPTPCAGCEHKPTPQPEHCRDFHSWRRNNDGKPWKENESTPCPPPPPPPCPSGKHAHVHARQAAGDVTTLQLELFYGKASAPVPIRQLQVTAFAIVNDRQQPLSAIGKADNNGFVTLEFPAGSDATLLIYRLTVSLDAEKFRVSTSNDGGKTFLYWRLNSVPLTWQIEAGGVADFRYRFMNKATNDILNVQDRMLNSWVFAKTKVHNFKAKLPAVFFPGNVGPNAFRPGATIDKCFINVHPDKATASSPLAHEYGHWFHYLTRGGASLESGPDGKNHNFCQAGITSTISALKEGYATAFGLSSLWHSRFEETTPAGGVGTGYCFWPFPATGSKCREIENYDCDAIPVADRDLSLDEGRVAATLRDLIDLANDDNASDPGRGVTGSSDALSGLSRRKVLYDPLRSNPTSMEEYWNNFKAVPGLTTAQIDAAWNVFEYQYAQFDK